MKNWLFIQFLVQNSSELQARAARDVHASTSFVFSSTLIYLSHAGTKQFNAWKTNLSRRGPRMIAIVLARVESRTIRYGASNTAGLLELLAPSSGSSVNSTGQNRMATTGVLNPAKHKHTDIEPLIAAAFHQLHAFPKSNQPTPPPAVCSAIAGAIGSII